MLHFFALNFIPHDVPQSFSASRSPPSMTVYLQIWVVGFLDMVQCLFQFLHLVDGVLAVGSVEAASEDGVLASYQDLSPYALSCILAEDDLNYIKVLACCYHYSSPVLGPVFPNSAWVVIWQRFT